MRRARAIARLTTAAMLLAGCAASEDLTPPAFQPEGATSVELPRQEVVVAVGDVPPPPGDVGLADEAEPGDRATLDVDVATFGDRWNEAAGAGPMTELVIDEWVVGYAQPSGDFTHPWAKWLVLRGRWDYATGRLELVSISFTSHPEADGELVGFGLLTLLIAVAGPHASFDLAADLELFELGAHLLPGESFSSEVVVDGVRYLFDADLAGGELVAEPA